ncbi:MAG: Fe-S protein assembly co-chaperone HscB [Gammaproteobacteria bacterium]|nr:Fe-S protein assembly co-chaperone HscB [Gammaproteobacteria bacterium]
MSFDLSSNYFEIFELPISFTIDLTLLVQRFRDLQQVVHPDRFASASDQERRISMQQSTRLNEAYQVLKDPLSRARYLLELNGIQWEDEKSTVSDTEFLMEQMELREVLSEVRGKRDPLMEVGRILDDVVSRIREMTDELELQFENSDEEHLNQAKEAVRKLQFLNKLKEEAESIEADLEDEL